jgi:hypothetical protein
MLSELKKAKETEGTAAAPILMMMNRSMSLAEALNAEAIAAECRRQSSPGTI